MIQAEFRSVGWMEHQHEKVSSHRRTIPDLSGRIRRHCVGPDPQYTAGPQTGSGGPRLKRSTRPVVSTYAGLLGSGVGANSGIGYQYFTRVQPQLQASRALGALGTSVNRLQAQSQMGNLSASTSDQQLLLQQGGGLAIGPTGHSVGYLSHTSYFGTNLQRNSGSGSSGSSASSTPNPSIPGRR
jgi:hypothetical protein